MSAHSPWRCVYPLSDFSGLWSFSRCRLTVFTVDVQHPEHRESSRGILRPIVSNLATIKAPYFQVRRVWAGDLLRRVAELKATKMIHTMARPHALGFEEQEITMLSVSDHPFVAEKLQEHSFSQIVPLASNLCLLILQLVILSDVVPSTHFAGFPEEGERRKAKAEAEQQRRAERFWRDIACHNETIGEAATQKPGSRTWKSGFKAWW